MNIYQKLNEIHKQVGYLQKNKKGKQYEYVGSSDVLAAVRQHMNEQDVILLPAINSSNVREFETKTGTLQIFTELNMTMTWVNTENFEEKIELPWYSQGMDLAGEKGVGKALTYGEKYFLMKFFNIATDKDDPDAFQERIDASKKVIKINDTQANSLNKLIGVIAKEADKTPAEMRASIWKKQGLKGSVKDLDEDQYGLILKYVNDLRTYYEKQQKEQQKEQEEEKEQESLFEGNTVTPKG